MKKSLSLLIVIIPSIIPCCCPGQSVITAALSAGSPSHGSANITFSYSGFPSSFRFRIAVAPATCTGGTGGYVVGSTSSNYQIRNNPQQANVGGLTSSTTYQVCPEITSDGNNWFGGQGVTFTTLALPNSHPALPVAPVSFNTNYPGTTGYQVYNLNSNCVDSTTGYSLQQDILTALANQVTTGSVINVAAGAVCRGQIYLSQLAADLITINASTVCPHTATSCTPDSFNTPHNFVEGDIAVFGGNMEEIGGGAALPAGILRGQNYYVHVLDPTHFQLTFPLPFSMGGSIVQLANQGYRDFAYYRRSGVVPGITYGQRNLHWIIIRPSTPDSQFVPAGTRLQGPLDANGYPTAPTNWLPKMFTLTMSNRYDGFASDNQLFSVSDQDGGIQSMNGYIRIVGAHFTFDPSPDSAGGKPMPHYRLFSSNSWNSDVVIDRSWFNPPPAPDENSGLIGFDGTNMAMVDSYLNNLKYYHAAVAGMGISVVSSNSFNISPGTFSFGSGKITLGSMITCTTSGSVSAASSAALGFTAAAKTLVVALPPGVTGFCSGYTPIQVVTENTVGNGVFNAGSHAFPNTVDNPGSLYWVDPVFSSDGTLAHQQSFWMSNTEPRSDPAKLAQTSTYNNAGTPYELGIRFQPIANGYIIGCGFYKIPADTGTHTCTLWDDSGANLITETFSSETPSGWQYHYFATPQAVTSGTFYRISYVTTQWLAYNTNFYQNGAMFNNGVPMIAPGRYVNNSGGGSDWSAPWPKYWNNRPNIGYFGTVMMNASGITGAVNADYYDDGQNSEGCQCVLAGNGPGPFVVKDNYFEGSGILWHFDDGGGYNLSRHDYTINRNWFYAPLSQMFTADGSNTLSDGMQYGHRHSLEWKQGNCGAIVGNIFDTSWVESTPFGDLFEISGINGAPGACGAGNQLIYGATSDFDIRSNTFEHAASVNSVFGPTPGSIPTFSQRFRFANNLMLDISGTEYCALGAGFCSSYSFGSGLIFQTSQMEDFSMAHNTMVGANAGSRLPFIFLTSISNQEGFNVRDNFLWINGVSWGADGTNSDTCGSSGTDTNCWGSGTWCKALSGVTAFNCAYANSSWINNVITGSPTQSQIQSLWPNNIVPSSPSNLNGIGWFNYTSPSVVGNYNLKSTSSYISGGTNHATDGFSMGVDYDQLQADQGYVTMGGVSNITTSSAQINFVAPDSQSCSIDYSPTDSTVTDNSLIRVPDIGTARNRNVTITGLSSGQIYYFRVNCAVNQPMGRFKTH